MAATPLRCSSPAFCLPRQPQSHPNPRSWGIRPYGESPRAAMEGEQGPNSLGSTAGLCSSVFGEDVWGGEQGVILAVCSSAVHDDEDAAVNRIA